MGLQVPIQGEASTGVSAPKHLCASRGRTLAGRDVESLNAVVRKDVVVSCCCQAPWVQTGLAMSTAVCSLLGLSCVFLQLPCHMGSPVRVPPCLWDHQRWDNHLCGLRNTLAVTFIQFMNFHGGISWISISPKFEEMQNALAHLWRNAVSGIQTLAISLGR